MNDIIDEMLSVYELRSAEDRENAIREIMQEFILYGLSNTDFYNVAAFMGGTSLRVFHGLKRYSEDLDFMLKKEIGEFEFRPYLREIERTMSSFGITVDSRVEDKTHRSTMDTGIVSTSAKELYLIFFPNDSHGKTIYDTQLTKIKIEIETLPAEGGRFENRFRTLPYPFSVSICTMPTLFAGKIHAVLCRGWANRVKGRDLYDLIFYVNKGTKVNLRFLENKLIASGYDGPKLDHDVLIGLLEKRFDEIDYQSAKQDVVRFIRPEERKGLDVWCADFFKQICRDIDVE